MNRRLFKVFSLITILALMLMALPVQSALAATVISQWNFESPNPADATDVATYPNAIAPAVGAGNAGGVHASAATDWSTPVGNGSADSFSSNTWAVGDYYQFVMSTSGYTGIQVSWDQTSSGTGPRDFKLSYSTDGTNFTDFGSPYIVLANASPNPVWNATTSSSLYSFSRDLSAITTLDNQPNVYFRLIDTSTTSASGGTVGTGGTNRVDNFTVSGTTIGDVAPSVSSTTPANGATNVAVNSNITVNFSENVDVAAGAISVECPAGTPVASNTLADNLSNVVIDPASDLPVSTTCAVHVAASGVTDEDTNDPPDTMGADFNFSFTTLTPIVSSVIINEVDSDNPSTDTLEFVELYDGGAGNTDLSGLVVVFYNGSNDLSYAAFDLDGFSTNANGYFHLGNAGVSPAPSITFADNFLQNGADAVALYGANAADFPNNTAITTANLVDAIVYDTSDADDPGLLVLLNSGEPQVNEDSGGNGTIFSNQRCPNGSGGARNTSTYAQFNPSAGVANICVNDSAPSVTSTNPTGGASNVSNSANIDITFSENVNVTGSWFSISCGTSGTHTAVASGGPTTFTLNPDTDFVNSETCTVTIVAAQVADQDTNDPPDNMTADFGFSFSTEGPVCEQTFTPIYSIQGSGPSAAITGNVTTQGVVVGDLEGPITSGIQGFYMQDATGDGNAATSDGIFVFTGDTDNNLSAGDVVRVTGFARERFNQTALNGTNSNTSPVTNIVNCGTGSVSPVDVTMPFASLTEPERFEGMLVRFPQALVISEYFNYDRFGEMVLALPLDGETRPFTGTAIDEPGAAANARTLANSLRRITLDDGLGSQNPPSLRHPNGDPFSLANRFRGGDTVQNTVGVLGFDFSLYRIQPTADAIYTSVNSRPGTPEAVGGSLRVAAMNTLNFFVTLDGIDDDPPAADNPADNVCGGNTNLDCRGADASQPTEFTRQRDKLLTALSGLDGDIIGLNELENTPGVEPLESITSGMPGYAYIDTGTIGTDAIKVGLIYRPAVVTPVGTFKLLTTAVDPRFIDTKSRPSLAQTFQVNATGAKFTVVVNHFKSKGSACTDVGDPDLGDGQGNCSQTRRAAAEALVDWLATDPTGSGDPDFLIMGDLNSYTTEDSIDEIKAGSDDIAGTSDDFTNLIAHFQGLYAYSYTFDGQAGYLDHALANVSIFPQVTGTADWHINSDEPDVLDYDTSFKPPAQEALYEVNPYRTSDHDAVVVGLNPLNTAPIAVNDGYSTDEDTTLTVTAPGVLSNDTDAESSPLTAALVSGPAHGMLTLNADGSFTYTPASNYNGPDSFTYKANDGHADSNIATVSITVNAVNDAPVAANDSYSTDEDTVLNTAAPGVLANDTDVDGDSLTAVLVAGPSHGSLTLNANGSFSYTPALNYNGPDSFTYEANDGVADSNIATVTITVNAVNDNPVATNDSVTVAKNSSGVIFILTNDSDVDGDTLTVTSFTQPAHGTVSYSAKNKNFRYTPVKGFTGTDTFTYTISDGHGGTATATVTITVQ